MTESQFQTISAAQEYVSDIFLNKINNTTRFHTLQHTQEVVMACEKMAVYYALPDEDHFSVLLAAWFHDTGYLGGQAKDHESVSVEMAVKFLNDKRVSPAVIEKVIGCINATRLPQNPTHLIEQIICDADLFHLGTEDFWDKNKLLRQELNEFGGRDISKKEWRKLNIEFLEKHRYFTSYALQNLQPLKEVYISELKEKVNGEETSAKKPKEDKNAAVQKNKEKNKALKEQEKEKAEELKRKKEKESQSERAISTVFRIMASNQANLSHMADNKAHIMISVNSIILSVVVSFLGKELDNNYYLIYPIIAIVATGVLTIVFSVLATRPNVTSGTFTKEDIADKKTNLLFFGNFHKVGLADYDWAMTEMLNDKNYLYSSMIKDNYFLGIVLAKKYKYLRLSYNIFMYGIIVSMIAFAITYYMNDRVMYTAG